MDHLTPTQAAEALGLSVPTVKRYIYEGRIRSAKLPGGQHRIPRSEVQRLLSVEQPPGATADAAAEEAVDPGTRVAVLEQWVSELQAEVERLAATLEVMSRFCARAMPAAAEPAPGTVRGTHQVLVLGTGCRRCEALHEQVAEVLRETGAAGVTLRRVTDADEIAAFGPVLTPALAVDDTVVVSGRVPTPRALRQLLAAHL